MNKLFATVVMAASLLGITHAPAQSTDPKVLKNQQAVESMAQDTLQSLYQRDPAAQRIVEQAAGYAVFSNIGLKILFAGTGNGSGVAVNKTTKAQTFMKMLEVQAGFGMGIKKFRVVFVFDNDSAFNSFVDKGWQFGGQATAAAKAGKDGAAMAGAISVSDGVWVYQMTDKGLALELTAKTTKYYKDDKLNSSAVPN
jgi:lipid-binding SYLF domain-containing protein